ncbi:MAG: tetratricopeptide repeat protein [Candidatus Latescibacterota bacterium]
MTICPFISHMLGEENANILTTETDLTLSSKSAARNDHGTDGKSVLILGYDGDMSNVQTKAVAGSSAGTQDPLSLSCMKESCRFYGRESCECMFDEMFQRLRGHEEAAFHRKDTAKSDDVNIPKELDKFWKFQTKSVSEMIASIGEAEINQKQSLDGFCSDISKQLESLLDRGGDDARLQLTEELGKFHNALKDREEVVENFSSTISEVVMNIEESLTKLSDKVGSMADRLDTLQNMKEELASWRVSIDPQIQSLHGRQDQWQDHFVSLQEQQDELFKFVQQEAALHESNRDRLKKKEAKKLNNLGVASFHNGAFDTAKEQFLRAVEMDERSAEAHNNLGLVYTELGEEASATDSFKKAIELNPGMSSAYTNLGYVFYNQGSYEQAIEMYNEALGRNHNSSAAYTNLGNAYFKLDKIDVARDAWEKAIDIDPSNEKAKRLLQRLR